MKIEEVRETLKRNGIPFTDFDGGILVKNAYSWFLDFYCQYPSLEERRVYKADKGEIGIMIKEVV